MHEQLNHKAILAAPGEVDGQCPFQPLFQRAQRIAEGDGSGREANQRFVRETLDRWLVSVSANKDAAT